MSQHRRLTYEDAFHCPARQVPESALAFGLKQTVAEATPLGHNPPTEPVAINRVKGRDAGVTLFFDVLEEFAESVLPFVGLGVPCPPGQGSESMLVLRLKCAFVAVGALLGDPRAELVAADYV